MPHRTSSRGHLVGEPPHPNKRTTIGLCSDDYWYGGQTTISLHTKPIVLREQITTASPLPALLLHPRERPILVGGLTYIGSRRDQYRYIPSTYIGQPTDQYRFTPPPHGGRAKGLIRHGNLPSARETKRPPAEGTTDSASTPNEVG